MSARLDVVIPMYNAKDHIEDCLRYLAASSFDDFKVYLVDDGSTDQSIALAQQVFPEAVVLRHPRNMGVAAARNRGIDAGTGEMVLFLDSDVLVLPDLLEQMVTILETRPDVSVVQARYGDVPFYRNLFSQYKHYVFSFRGINATRTDGYFARYVHTACVVTNRDVVRKIRFDETMIRGEDIEFGKRCLNEGFHIFSPPWLWVDHKKAYSLASFSRYQFKSANQMVAQVLNEPVASPSADETVAKTTKLFFYDQEELFYKKLWLLRPVVAGLLLWLPLVWLFLGDLPAAVMGAVLLLLSFLMEFHFRVYVWHHGPLWISIAAFFVYFYDGLLTLSGILLALARNWPALLTRLRAGVARSNP